MNNAFLHIEKNQVLDIYHGKYIHEFRGIDLEKMIRKADQSIYSSQKYKFLIHTGDIPTQQTTIEGVRCYSFSTINDNYSYCCPCFGFSGWPEVGFENYSNLIDSFIDTKSSNNKIGWIGNPMSTPRQLFHKHFSNTYFTESIINEWNINDPNKIYINTKTYLNFQQQINRWKYLIDFEGAGYSGRTKILLNSPRIVFIVDRPYKEFWYEKLIPWQHFIPIKRDLSDLEENYNKIESDIELQRYIRQEQKQFSKNYLQYYNAIYRFKNIIEENIYV